MQRRRPGRIWAAMLTWLLLPGIGAAQDWSMSQFDDGSYFSATLAPVDGPGPALVCGERSPQGVSPAVTGNTEPDITPPGAFRVYISDRSIGVPGVHVQARDDVLLVAGDSGFRLRGLRWNELFSTWEVDLPANDPAFAAIANHDAFELRSDRGSDTISSLGFAKGLQQLAGYCSAMFGAVGLPWPQQGAVAGQAGQAGAMRRAAEADIRRGCNGPARWSEAAFRSGNVDGDGAEDIVLDWREVTCSTGLPRPYCGAAMCSANVYLSALYPQKRQPEGLLALAVRLQPLNNGNDAVALGGALASCRAAFGTDSCEFLWYWTGSGLTRLH